MDVVVFGSAIIDFICYVPRLPKPGETLHGKSFETGYGGKGANQCVAAAKLGATTAMITKLGNDDWGKKYLKRLTELNVNTQYIETCSNETTGIAQISVADGGENSIIIVTGANNLLNKNDVKKASSLLKDSKVLICQLETPVEATIEILREFPGVSILNAAPALEKTPSELLKYSSIFCVNESEAALMTGLVITNVSESKAALIKLVEMGANTVIITLGKYGAVYVEKNKNQVYHVPVKEVEKVVDTTGAGDAFIGSLAYLIARYPDQPLYKQVAAACDVASISVQHKGTQSSFPDASMISFDLSKEEYTFNSF